MAKWMNLRKWWSRSKAIKWVLRGNKVLLTCGAVLGWLAFTAANSWGPHGWIVGLVGTAVVTMGGLIELLDYMLRLPDIEPQKVRVELQEQRLQIKRQNDRIAALEQAVTQLEEQLQLQAKKAPMTVQAVAQ